LRGAREIWSSNWFRSEERRPGARGVGSGLNRSNRAETTRFSTLVGYSNPTLIARRRGRVGGGKMGMGMERNDGMEDEAEGDI
jgi:hypothetical protein